MEALTNILTDMMGPLGPLIVVGGLGVLMIVGALPFMLKKEVDPLEKLKQNGTPATADNKDKLRNNKRNQRLERYSSFLEPQNEKEYSAMRIKLLQAGYRSKDSVRYFHFAQFALGIFGLLGGVIYFIAVKAADQPDTQTTVMYILGPGGVGYLIPKYWINKRQAQRQEEITNGFPDALDMLLVCVEAGQSMDQAILRVAKEIRVSYPSLADEFELVSHEIKAGKDKASVLGDMAERCGVPDIASFVTVLIQSASFGTSVADALRVYASEMRDKRVMRAEEKANKLPTKMTLATMMLTVPPLLIILIGPSVLGITKMGEIASPQAQQEAQN
ncbi:type II/IV secretion system protein, TadC subfamily protein [Pseudooceanicola batsensis HTCC2597]|uniref:Type II/IV secretion system protein, TadC subfamily protein n=1 Tax=Pseudooceanicola batsensis (strain ATCC BAA-863 / DSM 15984 / KCTC 12145 / HTCC2597) TaxID=252305 RepID=A3TZ33_PSEBH|nr:type II secretion system F family protein [Pseudooceanicola batsensis]EAQ02851.1 type II/IV secretion system protein, TadC subfamily protein [Pseudooceanicola batsensis HTCC2597]